MNIFSPLKNHCPSWNISLYTVVLLRKKNMLTSLKQSKIPNVLLQTEKPFDQDYMGHVFWDQETWMYPPILLLHGRIGRALLQTRVRTLGAARRTAKMTGYTGARYPWETALSGRKQPSQV